MAKLKGKWKFNREIILPTSTSDQRCAACAYDWGDKYYLSNGEINYTNGIVFSSKGLEEGYGNNYIYQDGEWKNGGYDYWSVIDFGGTEVIVSNLFYEIFTANATQLPLDTVTITYDGTILAGLKAGQSVAIKCAGITMEDDIIVTAPEKSSLPIEVASESEMNALLGRAEIGSIFKYMGVNGTYKEYALYIIEESDGTEHFRELV